MRIYEGSPRQDFEEVLRSIGAFIDQRGMREILLDEVPDGFVVQGLAVTAAGAGGWAESVGSLHKETLTFFDDDISRFMDEAAARRNSGQPTPDLRRGRAIREGLQGHRALDRRAEAAGHLLLRAGRRLRPPTPDVGPDWHPAHARGVHPRGHRSPRGGGTVTPRRARQGRQLGDRVELRITSKPQATEVRTVKALKIVAAALGITLATLVVLPLLVLTGLFVWLKLTEEADEEALELEAEAV